MEQLEFEEEGIGVCVSKPLVFPFILPVFQHHYVERYSVRMLNGRYLFKTSVKKNNKR